MISLYCASKFALEGFSEALAYELASQNIGVKIIEPHGGVSSTRFSERSASEYLTDDSLKDDLLKDYGPFVARTNEIFNGLRQARMMSADGGPGDPRRHHGRHHPAPLPGRRR
jgi:NAD(P)-dependent dehydrogenase (short-subunit alcohol dehydrogenase family)